LKNLLGTALWGIKMIKDNGLIGINSEASLDETIKIMDEMERLLCEMKEILRTIQRIPGENIAGQPPRLSIGDNISYFPTEHVRQSS
jgi:hypothetical protein